MNSYEGLSITERFRLSRIARKAYKTVYGVIPEGYDVDHIDHNPLNNEIENLRLLTRSENLRNRRKFTMKESEVKSKYKGVYWCKKRKKWIAQLRYKSKTFYIGQFLCEISASEAFKDFVDIFDYGKQ